MASDSSEDGNDAEPDQGQGRPGGFAAPEMSAADGAHTPQSRRRRSSFARSSTVVPRAERRGLLGRLTLIPEIENSYDYRKSTKWTITAIVALAAAGAPMGSSIFMRE